MNRFADAQFIHGRASRVASSLDFLMTELASAAVDAWLGSVGGQPLGGEAAAFFWLQQAAEEIG